MQIELPSSDTFVLPGIPWGPIEAFPTPAYWTYQVMARRIIGISPRHRLGSTLAEEVGACLLGGHGIPASVGLAAFQRLQALGILANTPTESEIFDVLSHPLEIDGRQIRYRFAKQKARYLSTALSRLSAETPPLDSGKALRQWLIQLPGIGLKTASWVARNWLDADDVAILDIHVLRAGALAKFFDENLTVEKNYLELEEQFIRFADAIGTRPSELDAIIWFEMMSAPRTVTQLMGGSLAGVCPRSSSEVLAAGSSRGRSRSNKGTTDTKQTRLFE
ncbi:MULTISPECIES: 8-oxoguanine DNA glycosylase [Methylomonas]|uniref:8-oxoguanine DNA glycosylase n=1 Tax=Methylomonas TaxID=416 RepID=UPI001E29E1B7|nr:MULTISPECIES: 8-oxoguanine DNA glycosylase [Methylomonas]